MTHWTTALWVLGAGAALGIVVAFVLRRPAPTPGKKAPGAKPPAPGPDVAPEDLDDLRARRDAALARLGELPEGKSPERQRLELEAATALRDLDRALVASRSGKSAPAPARTQGAFARGWLWGIGSAAFAVAVVFALKAFTRSRASGGSMVGDDQASMPAAGSAMPHHPAATASDPKIVALEKQVKAAPDDLGLRCNLAEALLVTKDGYYEAFEQAKTVLAKDPDNGRALVVEAAVRDMMGENQKALELVEHAIAHDPTLVSAWITRGREALLLGRGAEAVESYEKAEKLDPSLEQMLEKPLALAKQAAASPNLATGPVGSRAGSTPDAPTADAPSAMGAASSGGAPDAPVPASGGPSISGTVELDPALQGQVPASAVVFVIVQDPKTSMPVAAARFPATSFPVSFTLGPANEMFGKPIPAVANVEAVLDAKGNASSLNAQDPKARAANVAAGATGVKLLLQASR